MMNGTRKEAATQGQKPSEIVEKFRYLGMTVPFGIACAKQVKAV
jgi:hypothetical protein